MGLKSAGSGILLGLMILGMASITAAQPEQSHPLSQIDPVDTGLNMEGNSINNISEIVLGEGSEPEGLVLDDLTITHEGRAQRFVLDYQNNEWRIENSNLNMNGNNISNFFGGPCPAGQFVVQMNDNGQLGCVSATQEVQDEYVNRAGDSMTGNLDMQGNGVLGLKRLQSSGSGVYIEDSSGSYNITQFGENGNVDIRNGNLDLFANNLDGVRNLNFVGSGNGDQYTVVYDETNGYFEISNSGEDVVRIDDSTNNLVLPNGGLDMQNFNIVNFFGAACPSGDVMVQVNSDGTFDCVDATGEVQGDFVSRSGDTMTGNLDMQGNGVLGLRQLESSGNGVYITDSAENYNITAFRENGNVDIPSGNLDMNGNNIANINSLTSYYGSMCPSGQVMVDVNNDGTFSCIDVANEVQNTYVNRAGDSMTGDLDMQSNSIQGTNGYVAYGGSNMDIAATSGNVVAQTSGSGSSSFSVWDSANSQNVLVANEGGNVDVPNGNLDMNGNSIANYYGSACPSGEFMVDVNDDGTFSCVAVDTEIQSTYVNRAGDTMTGTLDMQSNNVDAVGTINSGGSTLNTGGDISVGSGTVTSGSTMCIGDQC